MAEGPAGGGAGAFEAAREALGAWLPGRPAPGAVVAGGAIPRGVIARGGASWQGPGGGAGGARRGRRGLGGGNGGKDRRAPRPGPAERALPWIPRAGAAATDGGGRGAALTGPGGMAGTLAGPSGRVMRGPSALPLRGPAPAPAPSPARSLLRQTLLNAASGARGSKAATEPGKSPSGGTRRPASLAGGNGEARATRPPPAARGRGEIPGAVPGARVLQRRRWHEQALGRLEGLYRREQGRELAQSHRRMGAPPGREARSRSQQRWGGGGDRRGGGGRGRAGQS